MVTFANGMTQMQATARQLFRRLVLEQLSSAVSEFDVQFAIARFLDDEPIASDSTAPLTEEAALARATMATDTSALVHRSGWGGLGFYAGVRLVDTRGRVRGSLALVGDVPRTFASEDEQKLGSFARRLSEAVELRDLAYAAMRDADEFRLIVEESAAAVYSIRDGRFSYVNQRFADVLGYTRDEILALDSFADLVPPAQRRQAVEMVRRRSAGEQRELRYRTKVRRSDGQMIDVEVHGSTADLQHERVVIGVAFDVTKRVVDDNLLRQREEYFRVVSDSIPNIVFILGPNGRFNFIGAAIEGTLGYAIEEQLGRSVYDIVHPDELARFRSVLLRLLRNEAIDRAEFRFQHKNGSWRLLEFHGTNLVEHPEIRGFVLSGSDVTEHRRLEQELEQLNRLSSLGRLSAQIAHEFNNVMMGIQPAVDVLRRIGSDDPRFSSVVDMISTSLGRGKRITGDILRFGRPAQLTLRPVNLNDLMRQAEQEVAPLLPRDIQLKVEVSTSTLHLRADHHQLAQVLMNMALNARDAMSAKGGTLTISAKIGGEHPSKSIPEIPNIDAFVHICVTDTGEGIRSEDLPYIFEPLFTTKKTGNGIGLSVAYQVVTAHGGHIFVESKRGEGTTFHMLLPRVRESLDAAEEAADRTSALDKRRVLLVEDDATVATGVRWILESEGMLVSVVGLASAALAAVEEFQPDIVVLDLSLPDGLGRALYEPISAQGLPVIFSTGSAGADDLIESGHGNVSVLNKPYSADDLLRAIDELLFPGAKTSS